MTEDPYFRFGFKLLALDGKVFGDGSIQSQDANLLVHIARNAWASPGITANDLFLTVYQNGKRTKKDARLFPVKPKMKVDVELLINNAFVASFTVNGRSCCEQVVPPEICYRAVMLGWDDHRDDFEIKVSDISVTTLK
ncbi:MAG: hypothetical protein NT154_24655 [Verrucomicrobia bacterium]|nr:hypothetical protein [Verrucomicrobiota bacterium]